jgi:hypothetical protein
LPLTVLPCPWNNRTVIRSNELLSFPSLVYQPFFVYFKLVTNLILSQRYKKYFKKERVKVKNFAILTKDTISF